MRERDQRRENGITGDEGACAVDRVEHPLVRRIRSHIAEFLADDAVFGIFRLDEFSQCRFDLAVSVRDRAQVGFVFYCNRLPEITAQNIAGFIGHAARQCDYAIIDLQNQRSFPMLGVMDIHARVQEFLQENSPLRLREGLDGSKNDVRTSFFNHSGGRGACDLPPTPPSPSRGEGDFYTKAGVVPFIQRKAQLAYYLMKPVAKNPGLDAPKFQLCKGTRMMKVGGVWVDMPDGMNAEIKESLAATALREGIEELGLNLTNIKALFDVGSYGFSSATTGKSKEMWLFAAEMGAEEFSGEVAPTTAECAWLTLQEFDIAGREDHRYILRDIESRLKE